MRKSEKQANEMKPAVQTEQQLSDQELEQINGGYIIYKDSSSDNTKHLRPRGTNVFGFEDLPNN